MTDERWLPVVGYEGVYDEANTSRWRTQRQCRTCHAARMRSKRAEAKA